MCMPPRHRWRVAALQAALAGVLAACGVGVRGPAAAPTGSGAASRPAGTRPASTAHAPTAASTGSGRGSPVWIAALQMVTPTAGWALRWTQNPAVADAAVLAVARTTDGGETWTDVTPAAARPLLTPAHTSGTFFALGTGRAWFAVSRQRSGQPARTVVFATSDGGRTWRAPAAFSSLGRPQFMYFDGPDRGWLLADLGSAAGSEAVALFATADGGARWSLVSRTRPLTSTGTGAGGAAGGIPLACDKTGIVFATPSTGWITGDCFAGPALVEVTHDGGRTWAAQALPVAGGGCGGSTGEALPPGFSGTFGHLVVTCFPRASLLVTQDAGATWSAVALPANAGAYPLVWFVSANQGLLVPGGPPDIAQGGMGDVWYRTSDGGRTWQGIRPGRRFTALGTSLDFVSATTGFAWVQGADATAGAPPLCRTSDSGRTWTCAVPRMAPAGT